MASPPTTSPTRWIQLLLGLVIMMAISSPQYVWTLFVKPFQAATGAALPTVQITFSVLIVLQTLFSPAQGWLVDRFGPKALVAVGAALTGLGWVISAHVDNVWMLFLTYGLFCGDRDRHRLCRRHRSDGEMVSGPAWIRDRNRRGGLRNGRHADDISHILHARLLRRADDAHRIRRHPRQPSAFSLRLGCASQGQAKRRPQSPDASHGEDVAPANMLKTPIFWLMFAMMTMMSTGGLMVTSNFANFAHDFGVANVLVLGLAALPFALTVDRLLNGFTRPFFGWASDRIGRENTMGLAFGLEAAAILLLLLFSRNAPAFVVLSGLVFFGWGEIFSLFPSTLADTFGSRYATTNYGFLYIAQGVGSILGGPVAAAMRVATGSWTPVFGVAVAMDIATALMALFVLKPMRAPYLGAQPSDGIVLALRR